MKTRNFLMILIILCFSLSIARQVEAQGSNPVCFVYSVTVSGRIIYDGYYKDFTQSGYVGITGPIQNSNNNANISLILGEPLSKQSVGALSFTSNGYFMGGVLDDYRNGALDLATVSVSNNKKRQSITLTAEVPDDMTSNFGTNQATYINLFNWEDGWMASYYLVVGGSVTATVTKDNTVTGEISLAGRGWTSIQASLSYTADIEGEFYGSYDDISSCVISSR